MNKQVATVAVCVTFFSILLLLQYPLQTTFPIGGDVTRYIARAEAVTSQLPSKPLSALTTLATNSRYPGAIFSLLPFDLLPLSWPQKFTWWTVFANLSVAAGLAYVAYKRAGPLAAAVSAFIWTLAQTQATRHFEDATIAQLVSLAPIPLFLHGVAGPHPFRAIAIYIPLATLLHPVSGFLLALLALGALPHLLRKSMFTPINMAIFALAIVAIFPLFWSQTSLLTRDFSGSDTASLPDLINSPIGPFFLLLPISLIYLWQTCSRRWAITLTLLTVVSLLLTFNHYLAMFATFPFRFQSYLVLAIALIGGTVLPGLLPTLSPNPINRRLFLLTLCATLTALSWHNSSKIYNFYESPSRYARLHPGEHDAILWSKNHLPSDSHLTSTTDNRHSEWIPILTPFSWSPIQEGLPSTATHLLIFKHREKSDEVLRSLQINPTPLYDTTDAAVYAL